MHGRAEPIPLMALSRQTRLKVRLPPAWPHRFIGAHFAVCVIGRRRGDGSCWLRLALIAIAAFR